VIDVPSVTNGKVLRVLMNADLGEALGFIATPVSTSAATEEAREPSETASEDHWHWRLRMAERMAVQLDGTRFGVKALYVFGSTKNATAGPGSDIDLLIHFAGSEEQKRELLIWLEGWSLCLAEINFSRSGYKSNGLLDYHLVTDEDIAKKSSYAVKIGAVTDAARLLTIKTT
jgi:pyruvate, water dikinase